MNWWRSIKSQILVKISTINIKYLYQLLDCRSSENSIQAYLYRHCLQKDYLDTLHETRIDSLWLNSLFQRYFVNESLPLLPHPGKTTFSWISSFINFVKPKQSNTKKRKSTKTKLIIWPDSKWLVVQKIRLTQFSFNYNRFPTFPAAALIGKFLNSGIIYEFSSFFGWKNLS